MLMGEVARYGGLAEAINTGAIHKCMRSAAAKENLATGQKSGFSPYAVSKYIEQVGGSPEEAKQLRSFVPTKRKSDISLSRTGLCAQHQQLEICYSKLLLQRSKSKC